MFRQRRVGHYHGLSVFVKFLQLENLTLSSDDLLQLKLVRTLLMLLIKMQRVAPL